MNIDGQTSHPVGAVSVLPVRSEIETKFGRAHKSMRVGVTTLCT